MTIQEIEQKLTKVAAEYPSNMVAEQISDIPRIAFNIALALPAEKPLDKMVICDVGGGIGLFSIGCATVGFGKVLLVDDFADQVNLAVGDSILDLHRRYGVQVISRDVVAKGLKDLGASFDVVTCFDSMEHWHCSPKGLFHELMSMMNPRGCFVVGVPNCVNLRKRLTVPLGRGKWSPMEEWYEPAVFRAHVREPDVDDLWYIARDLKLENVRILGRNWLGYKSKSKWMRTVTGLVDPLIQFRPSLCSNLYLVGEKARA
jgi:2-polyprenyl-3-methyl-5-hydroxy-6-metoxy-1,4-benzoquinol methylase